MTIIGNTLLSRDQIASKAKVESDDYLAMIDAYGNPACVLVSDLLDDLPMNSALYFDPGAGRSQQLQLPDPELGGRDDLVYHGSEFGIEQRHR